MKTDNQVHYPDRLLLSKIIFSLYIQSMKLVAGPVCKLACMLGCCFYMVALQSQIISSEFIFTEAPFLSCHASTLVEAPNGDLMAAWFGGTREGNPDVAIWWSTKRGSTWTSPQVLAKENNTPCYNPVLFYTDDGKLWFYYKFGTHPSIWSAARKYSLDNGTTWSSTEYLPAGWYGPIRTKPLILKNGIVVSGTSVESYRNWAVWIERSKDHGKSFQKIGPITVPKPKKVPSTGPDAGANDWEHTYGIIQPSIVSLSKKHLRLYARSTSQIGHIVISDSYDQGISWTPGKIIDLPNPNSGIDAMTLRDGRIALVYNHAAEGRSPLNVAMSNDGTDFKMIYTLEDEPEMEFSYPYMIQDKEGLLHITYTWKRLQIKHVVIRI